MVRYHTRQGRRLEELCSGAGRRRETGSVLLKVGDWAGWAWWSGVGRMWGMRPARQPVVLGPEWDGHCEGPGQPQLLLNIVAGAWPGGSGKAAGELGTGQEARSRPTAAAGPPDIPVHSSSPSREPDPGLRPEPDRWEQGATGAGKDSAPMSSPFFPCLPGGKRSTRCGCSCSSG